MLNFLEATMGTTLASSKGNESEHECSLRQKLGIDYPREEIRKELGSTAGQQQPSVEAAYCKVMLMAQKLEVPTRFERLNPLDQQILRLLKAGELQLEEVVALTDADQSEVLSAVTRLIADGCLELMIVEYPWGMEFELELNGSARRRLDLGAQPVT